MTAAGRSGLVPIRATGLLRRFAEAGVLAASDVHVALRLARLGAEQDETVLLAVALAVRGVRAGSVCVALDDVAATVQPEEPAGEGPGQPEPGTAALPWPTSWAAVAASPLVAVGGHAPWRPLRLVDGLLYLDRYWQQEQLVRRRLDEHLARPLLPVDLSTLPAGAGPDRQRLAVAVAAVRPVSVLTGGPGTGKTHTVAQLLALLRAQPGTPPRIALAAPTGKAAARLQESVSARAGELSLPDGLTASTLHRLLGWRPGSRSRFAHHAGNTLPYDVVVVDESSMVSLTLMARLLDAVGPSTRLVLVGDPDQLTSVEAGAVLSDLVHRLPPAAASDALPAEVAGDAADLDDDERRQLRHGVVRLTVPHRFGTAIASLADAVRRGDADAALDLLRTGPGLSLEDDDRGLRDEVVRVDADLRAAAAAGDARAALDRLGRHRLLCAHRRGPAGVSRWNDRIADWTGAPGGAERPVGQPLLVTANDPDTGLHNGDTGVVVTTDDGPRAAFGRAGGPVLVALSRLPGVETAHALTVHRSQGSQYEAVTVLLPPAGSAVLTRELLYTAVTRASLRVRVLGGEAAVRAAVGRPVVRASGLRRTPV